MSLSTLVWQLKRRPGFSPLRSANLSSGAVIGSKLSAVEVIPNLANSPSLTKIWQRPQMPLAPHTESISTLR